jgi:hypothetical protein
VATLRVYAEGVDFSYGRPDLALLRTLLGPSGFVARYISGAPPASWSASDKTVTPAEIEAIHAAGLGVLLVYEATPGFMLGGSVKAAADAPDVLAWIRALRLPEHVPIRFALDLDADQAQLSLSLSYLQTMASAIGRSRVSGYGGVAAVEAWAAQAAGWGWWQTYAWSGGQVSPHATLLQYSNNVPLAGANVDRDRLLVPPDQAGIWWPQEVAMSIPERLALAQWRPLGTAAQEAATTGIVPRVLIFHTMVGFLRSVDAQFRVGAFDGLESTFGVGGPYDGAALDGQVWQWQSLTRAAEAQWDGNSYANSVETSDGGLYLKPWSPKQVAALIVLGYQWCRATGNPAVLVTSSSGHGFGYHRQFPEWNRSSHACPGDTRIAQLKTVIIPGVQAMLAGNPPGGDVPLDATDKAFIQQLSNRNYSVMTGRFEHDSDHDPKTPPVNLAQDIIDTREEISKLERQVAAQAAALEAMATTMGQILELVTPPAPPAPPTQRRA